MSSSRHCSIGFCRWGRHIMEVEWDGVRCRCVYPAMGIASFFSGWVGFVNSSPSDVRTMDKWVELENLICLCVLTEEGVGERLDWRSSTAATQVIIGAFPAESEMICRLITCGTTPSCWGRWSECDVTARATLNLKFKIHIITILICAAIDGTWAHQSWRLVLLSVLFCSIFLCAWSFSRLYCMSTHEWGNMYPNLYVGCFVDIRLMKCGRIVYLGLTILQKRRRKDKTS